MVLVRCVAAIEWGPVATWASAVATFLTALIAVLVAQGRFARFRAPRIRITFDDAEPWCRTGVGSSGRHLLWVRVGVENIGRGTAHGCVGRLMGVTTDGQERADVDPVQLRWAGVPRSRSFDAIDLRPDQREFLNVLLLVDDGQ